MLRTLFSGCGHITGFRLVGPNPGSPYLFGSVDYMDAKSAADAVQLYHEHPFIQESILSELNATEVKMKVTLSTYRKRARAFEHGDRRHTAASTAEDADGGPFLELKPGVVNPILPADKTIENALRTCPIADAYEAVEQLRVLAADRPDEAVQLLAQHPQLGVAVVMILQHAGKMPMGPLPAEALRPTVAAPQAPPQASSSSGSAASENSSQETLPDEVIAHVMKIVASLPEEQVEQISKMTAEDFAKIPDPAQRLQLQTLQKQLHLLGQSL